MSWHLERRAALLLLGAGGCLTATAVLFSDGSSNGPLVWLGIAALTVAAAVGAGALAGVARPAPGREAWLALALLAAFVVWCGISVLWSIQPDRSWDYLNRGLVYLALAAVGLALGSYVPRAPRLWACVLSVVLALALGWALLGKAVPALGSSGRIARLASPVGYWNALALLFDQALPLALWLAARREHAHWLRGAGVVYVYALVVGLLLTYSRGGVLVGGVVVALWLAFSGPRIEGAAALLLGGGVGVGVAVWAFSRPGLAKDLQPHSVRVHDGAWFALVFCLAAVAVAALAYLASVVEEQRPLSEARRRLVGRAALGVVAAGAAAAVVVLIVRSQPQAWWHDFSSQPTNPAQLNTPGRLANLSSSSRWLWWKEAWQAFEDQPLRGTGAGSFELTHRLLRTNNIVVTEPHNVPLQFLSETGIVGLLLALGSVAAAAVGVVRALRRLEGPERAVAVALALSASAYLLHSIVDFDWDFVAVSAPFFLTVGVLLGGGTVRAQRQPYLAVVPVAFAIAVALSLLTPWFAKRAADSASNALIDGRPVTALNDAKDARSLNPLALQPLFYEAAAAEQLGDYQDARILYVRAIRLQPLNWRPWYELGRFESRLQLYDRALSPLERAVELDPYGSSAPQALKEVRAHTG
jgi:tetratricopeptide (TPR) repeat protein